MTSPLISIVIPAYNAERFLAETIESVLAQTLARWELLVVDDGSADKTQAIAREYALRDDRIRALSQAHAGVSTARNHGYRHSSASSPYLAFLDADDRYKPDALQALADRLALSSEVIGAHGLAEMIDAKSRSLAPGLLEAMCRPRPRLVGRRVIPSEPHEPTTFECLLVSGCIATPGVVLIRRSALDRVGLFDPELSHSQDWDLYIRLSRYGDFAFLDRVVLEYRKHGSGLSDNKDKARAGKTHVLRKAYASSENTSEHLKTVKYSYRATQRYELNQKFHAVRKNMSRGDLKSALTQWVYFGVSLMKYVKGSP